MPFPFLLNHHSCYSITKKLIWLIGGQGLLLKIFTPFFFSISKILLRLNLNYITYTPSLLSEDLHDGIKVEEEGLAFRISTLCFFHENFKPEHLFFFASCYTAFGSPPSTALAHNTYSMKTDLGHITHFVWITFFQLFSFLPIQ